MKRFFRFIFFTLLVILIFWLGKQYGSKSVNQSILSNSLIVKEIAELASLDVQGVANIKRSNIEEDGSWTSNMKKAFLENTIWVSVPYEAKYGVDVSEKNFHITLSDKKILVKLPAPHLLSYELKVDKMETANRKGWLLFQDDETYTDVQKKLYQTSREQLENNQLYLTQSKDKIAKIITQYYQPFLADHQLEITFDNSASKTLK
ncbi:DUF4230 domain-containing protein [Chitinophaga oryziterrae]|uniref:DUF4230 domain-containing protein n=1 Tax=Chitinophaga oryziterrae TaxID=1031224 RepID=A0A6N8JAM8_9BACT|nr:DUF4230 domain-containing protein [Chitinophaga oryziterrae]MVT41309.1 DUF4230 domain-containing protein [Chitinophaga oryziterrae]